MSSPHAMRMLFAPSALWIAAGRGSEARLWNRTLRRQEGRDGSSVGYRPPNRNRLRPVVPLHPQQTFAAANSNRLHVSHAVSVDDSSAASRVLATIMEISEVGAGEGAYRQPIPTFSFVEDVARILRCTADTARRIPRDQLRSISGPGRRQLYLREDVIALCAFSCSAHRPMQTFCSLRHERRC